MRADLSVLVVDDDRNHRVLVGQALSLRGCQVSEAADGPQALAAVQKAPFRLLLMDLQMPGWSGLETTRRIRSLERELGRRPCWIVALTSCCERAACLEAGMDEHMLKPFQEDLLSKLLQDISLGLPPSLPVTLASARPSQGLVNLSVIQEFSYGDLEFEAALLGEFCASALKALGHLNGGFERGDWEAVAQAAHGLRGQSYNLGATALGEACQALERWAKAPVPEELDSALSHLEQIRHWVGENQIYIEGLLLAQLA